MNSLPLTRPFSKSLVPFAGGYAAYVALEAVPLLSPEAVQGAKLLVCSLWLLAFRRSFRLQTPSFRGVFLGAAAALPAMVLWVLPLWWINRESASPIAGAQASLVYWGLRTFNSVILIAIAEELLVRGFLTEWLFQAEKRAAGLSRLWDALWKTFDEAPRKLKAVPFSAISFLGGCLFFVLGHSPQEYFSALLYYGFTHWVYLKTRSLVIVMGIHGLVNAGIALAVRFGGWQFLWFG